MGHDLSESTAEVTETGRARVHLFRAAGGKFGYLLVALIALLLSAPLLVEGRIWNLGLKLFASAVLVASLYAARPGRRSLTLGLILAAIDLGVGQVAMGIDLPWLLIVQLVLWLSTLIFVTIKLLEWILESPRVTVDTLKAALCVYLLLGLVWVFLYALIDVTAPGELGFPRGVRFAWTDDQSRRSEFMRLFYLSYTTLTGRYFGDIPPAGGFARMCICLVAVTAQMYLAMLIARLVGMHVSAARAGQTTAPGDATGISQAKSE